MEPTDFNKYGFDLAFRMDEKTTGRAVACGKVGIVFVNPGSRSVAVVPAVFLERLGAMGTGT
jgi:acyl-CoA thioesterase FadM